LTNPSRDKHDFFNLQDGKDDEITCPEKKIMLPRSIKTGAHPNSGENPTRIQQVVVTGEKRAINRQKEAKGFVANGKPRVPTLEKRHTIRVVEKKIVTIKRRKKGKSPGTAQGTLFLLIIFVF